MPLMNRRRLRHVPTLPVGPDGAIGVPCSCTHRAHATEVISRCHTRTANDDLRLARHHGEVHNADFGRSGDGSHSPAARSQTTTETTLMHLTCSKLIVGASLLLGAALGAQATTITVACGGT